ncbi:MAG: ZIP family metal transporter [Gilvibacter sp.]
MRYLLLFLAVFVGFAVAQLIKNKDPKRFALLLAFSGAFLLSVTLFEMMPELFAGDSKDVGMYIMLGILLQLVLDFFSKGAEHGHVHLHGNQQAFPILLFASLSVHAVLEGFPVTGHDSILYGVVVHKIPIAAILTLFFIKANQSLGRILIFLTLFALMTPLGSYLAEHSEFLAAYKTPLNAIAVGVFLHVSTTILFESNKDHGFNLTKMLSIVLGIVLAYFL